MPSSRRNRDTADRDPMSPSAHVTPAYLAATVSGITITTTTPNLRINIKGMNRLLLRDYGLSFGNGISQRTPYHATIRKGWVSLSEC